MSTRKLTFSETGNVKTSGGDIVCCRDLKSSLQQPQTGREAKKKRTTLYTRLYIHAKPEVRQLIIRYPRAMSWEATSKLSSRNPRASDRVMPSAVVPGRRCARTPASLDARRAFSSVSARRRWCFSARSPGAGRMDGTATAGKAVWDFRPTRLLGRSIRSTLSCFLNIQDSMF